MTTNTANTVVLSVKKGLEDIRNHMSNARVYVNFEKCIKCFAGGAYCDQDANLLDFFKSIAEDPEGFKDRANFPPTWKSDNSIIAGVSSISQAADTPSIKKALEPEVFATVKQNLLAYMHALKGLGSGGGGTVDTADAESTAAGGGTADAESTAAASGTVAGDAGGTEVNASADTEATLTSHPVAVDHPVVVVKRRGRPPKAAASASAATAVSGTNKPNTTPAAQRATRKDKEKVVVVHKHDVNGHCCSVSTSASGEGEDEGEGSQSEESLSEGREEGEARARSDADVLETLFLMLNEARNVIAEKNKTIQRLVHECRELKQIGTDAGLRRELDLTKKRLEICTTYIQKTAVDKDPAMLEAFMTLLQMSAGMEV